MMSLLKLYLEFWKICHRNFHDILHVCVCVCVLCRMILLGKSCDTNTSIPFTFLLLSVSLRYIIKSKTILERINHFFYVKDIPTLNGMVIQTKYSHIRFVTKWNDAQKKLHSCTHTHTG